MIYDVIQKLESIRNEKKNINRTNTRHSKLAILKLSEKLWTFCTRYYRMIE